MRHTNGRAWITLGLLLGCSAAPPEVTGIASGSTGTSATTGSAGSTASSDSSGAVDPDVGGSGGSGIGDPSRDGDTTQGVQLGTSTGEPTTTDEPTTTSTDPVGTSTGDEPSSTSTGDGPSCDELYGAAPGYVLCMETDDACHFNANTSGGNCTEMCTMLGGVCLDAFDNSDSCTILRPDMDTCETDRSTEICVCAK